MQYHSLSWLLLGLTGCSATRIVATDQVPLLGPSFISNFNNSRSQAINEAISEFPDIIEDLFSSGDLNRTDLIFAVDVFSASTNASIYSYYHVGEGQEYALGAGRLDDQTVSRVGSVSKIFTAYAIIAQAGIEVFSHPVTRYLPELAGNRTGNSLQRIDWSDITVGALLSQQAGSGGPTGISVWVEAFTGIGTPPAYLLRRFLFIHRW
jgi:CubicO group peptidase (beta-lactamase class C family)